MLRGTEELGNVFDYENGCAGTLHNFQEGPPQLFARIVGASFVEKTEPLARRAADDDIRLRNDGRRIVQQPHDVAAYAPFAKKRIIPKICIVRGSGVRVKIVGPYTLETMPEGACEAERESSCAAE